MIAAITPTSAVSTMNNRRSSLSSIFTVELLSRAAANANSCAAVRLGGTARFTTWKTVGWTGAGDQAV
jgi:hypothetical protein